MNISNQFIDQLVNNNYFISSIHSLYQSFCTQNYHGTHHGTQQDIQTVVEQISQTLQINFKNVVQKEYNYLYESNRQIMQEIQHLKSSLKHSPTLKTQSSTAQRDTKSKLQTSIFFDNDEQYDMKQIRKHFDQQIENKILINSFQLDEQDKTYIDQQIQDKINASIQGSINRIELSLEEKFQKYSVKIQQRIQQLRKTIASVVEAMNQKQYWNNHKDKSKTNNNSSVNNLSLLNAFSKKEVKPNEKQKQIQSSHQTNKQTVLINQKQISPEIKHTQKLKNPQNQQNNSHTHSHSNKAIQSLNNSISLGRTRIKSLFGFKSSTTKCKNSQSIQNSEL